MKMIEDDQLNCSKYMARPVYLYCDLSVKFSKKLYALLKALRFSQNYLKAISGSLQKTI